MTTQPTTTAVDTAVTGVDAANLAGSVNIHDMSMFGLFLQADFVVKSVMIGLLIASLWCWAIIFDKWARFKSVRFRADRFQDALWSSDDLEKFYNKVEKREDHPMASVFVAGMQEWFRSRNIAKDKDSKESLKIRMDQIMGVARNRSVEQLEKYMGFLATIGSTAPFIGLFGTVWGIMRSFQSIATAKNTSLAVVAPGIAEALLATAIGLVAAIPAVIFYNKLVAELGRINGQLEDFSIEFSALISRQLDGGK